MDKDDKLKGAKFGLFIKVFFINSFNRVKKCKDEEKKLENDIKKENAKK